jgi:hypothetical protein
MDFGTVFSAHDSDNGDQDHLVKRRNFFKGIYHIFVFILKIPNVIEMSQNVPFSETFAEYHSRKGTKGHIGRQTRLKNNCSTLVEPLNRGITGSVILYYYMNNNYNVKLLYLCMF